MKIHPTSPIFFMNKKAQSLLCIKSDPTNNNGEIMCLHNILKRTLKIKILILRSYYDLLIIKRTCSVREIKLNFFIVKCNE